MMKSKNFKTYLSCLVYSINKVCILSKLNCCSLIKPVMMIKGSNECLCLLTLMNDSSLRS